MAGRTVTVEEWQSEQAEEERVKAETINAFREAVRKSDLEGFVNSFCDIAGNNPYLLERAFKAIRNLPPPSIDIRQAFVWAWLEWGDGLRSQITNDVVLLDALWKLLPPYEGPRITLYRGELFANRRRRSYGMSWTKYRDMGEGYAKRDCYGSGGSVLLETIAEPGAIICACPRSEDKGEGEFVVDRRRLGKVRVLERFSN
jgi:hypothetical protein